MAKFGIQKGDLITFRRAHTREENSSNIIAHGETLPKTYKVTKVWPHGVRVQGFGYVHNNCILSKQTKGNE